MSGVEYLKTLGISCFGLPPFYGIVMFDAILAQDLASFAAKISIMNLLGLFFLLHALVLRKPRFIPNFSPWDHAADKTN